MVLGQVGEPNPLPAAAGTATEQRRAAISADRNRHAGREQPIDVFPGGEFIDQHLVDIVERGEGLDAGRGRELRRIHKCDDLVR